MNAPNASGWKPGTPAAPTGESGVDTVTGNRGLMLEERLIFEIGGAESGSYAGTQLALRNSRVLLRRTRSAPSRSVAASPATRPATR